jgi:hypothetical protein
VSIQISTIRSLGRCKPAAQVHQIMPTSASTKLDFTEISLQQHHRLDWQKLSAERVCCQHLPQPEHANETLPAQEIGKTRHRLQLEDCSLSAKQNQLCRVLCSGSTGGTEEIATIAEAKLPVACPLWRPALAANCVCIPRQIRRGKQSSSRGERRRD